MSRMNMKRKTLLAGFAAIVAAMMFCGDVGAAKLDAYRNIMASKSFTVKYEVDVPDKPWEKYSDIEVYEKDGEVYPIVDVAAAMSGSKEGEKICPPYKGVVVIDNQDKYAEVIRKGCKIAYKYDKGKIYLRDGKDQSNHFLKRNGEKFYYFHILWGSDYKYCGYVKNEFKSGKIEPGNGHWSPQEAMKIEVNYGHPVIGEILLAIHVDEDTPAMYAPPAYSPAGEGRLDDGLFYEDYSAEQGGVFYAMRYYFDGDTLVKVSRATYKQTADGEIDASSYETRSVNIKEFSPTPERKYLSLPEGLVDVSKKGKKGGSEE